jgi:hypothetical protein
MKLAKSLTLLAVLSVLIPAASFARDKNQGKMVLDEPAQIGSTQLKPGTYNIEWQGSGPAVNVEVTQRNKTLATVPGQLKTNDAEASQDAVVLAPSATNSSQKQVVEIDFGSRKEALVINPGAMNAGD